MRTYALFVPLIILSGCFHNPTPGNSTAQEVTSIVREIKGTVDDLKKKQDELDAAQKLKRQKDQEIYQFLADRIFIARFANDQNPLQSPYSQMVRMHLVPAQKAVELPPSAGAQEQATTQLQQALSKEREDREAIQKKADELLQQATELSKEKKALEDSIVNKQKELDAASSKVEETTGKLSSKEAELKLKAKEAEDAANAERKALAAQTRMKFASAAMWVGGALIVAAIVATALHVAGVLVPGLVGGAAFLLVGWIITYVEDLLLQKWFQFTVGGSLAVGLLALGWVFFRQVLSQRHKAQMDAKISTNVVGALQDLKNDDLKLGTSKFAPIAPYLKEWHQTPDGKPDVALEHEIDQRLVKMNLKPVTPVENATLPTAPTLVS